jgi:hypothetical protein
MSQLPIDIIAVPPSARSIITLVLRWYCLIITSGSASESPCYQASWAAVGRSHRSDRRSARHFPPKLSVLKRDENLLQVPG